MGTPQSASLVPVDEGPAATQCVTVQELYQNISASLPTTQMVVDKVTDKVTDNVTPSNEADGNAVIVSDEVELGSTEHSIVPDDTALSVITVTKLNSKMKNSDFPGEFTANIPEQNDVQIVSVTPASTSTNGSNQQDEKEILLCPECPYECNVENEMILHMFTHCDFTIHTNTGSSDFHFEDDQYSCHACAFKSPSRLVFREHIRCHVSPQPYSCIECGAFVSLINMRSHYKASHEHSDPSIRVTPSLLVDRIMQKLGPSALHLDAYFGVQQKDASVASTPTCQTDQPDKPLYNVQDTTESCQTKTKHTSQQLVQGLVAHCSDKEAEMTASSAQNYSNPPVRGNVDKATGNENAAPQVSVAMSSHGVPVSNGCAGVKPPGESQSDQEVHETSSRKPTGSSENEIAAQKPIRPTLATQSPATKVIVLKPKKQTLKLLFDYDGGMFMCKSCNLNESDEVLFRKHIWQDIHRHGGCTHGGSAVNIGGCTILNNLMFMLLTKRHSNDVLVNKKQTSIATPAACVSVKTGSQSEMKQTTARKKKKTLGTKQTTAEINQTGAERKQTRAAARAATKKLQSTTKNTKNEDEDEDFNPDDSGDEDYTCSGSSTTSEEDDDKDTDLATADESIEYSDASSKEPSMSDNSGCNDKNRSEIEHSLKSVTSELMHGNENCNTPEFDHWSDNANPECLGETVNSATAFKGSPEPATCHDDKNDSLGIPEFKGLSCSVIPEISCKNSATATYEESFDSDTSEPNKCQGSPEHDTSGRGEKKGGSANPKCEESSDSTTSKPMDEKKSSAYSEFQESLNPQTSEQGDKKKGGSVSPPYERSSNSATSEPKDKKKSSAYSEFQESPNPQTSEQGDKRKGGSVSPPYERSSNSATSEPKDMKKSSANSEFQESLNPQTSEQGDKKKGGPVSPPYVRSSNSATSEPKDKKKSSAYSEFQESPNPQTSEQGDKRKGGSVSPPYERSSNSATSEPKDMKKSSANSEFQESLNPQTSEQGDKKKGGPVSPPYVRSSNSATSEPKDMKKSSANSEFQESPNPQTSEQGDKKKGGSVNPPYERSSNSATSEPKDMKKSSANSEFQESPNPQTSEQGNKKKGGSVSPPYEQSSNSATSEPKDKKKSSANSEFQGSLEANTSEQGDRGGSVNPPNEGSSKYTTSKPKFNKASSELNGSSGYAKSVFRDNDDPQTPDDSKIVTATNKIVTATNKIVTATNKNIKGHTTPVSNRNSSDENCEISSDNNSDDVIVLSEQSDNSVTQSSVSASSELGVTQKVTRRSGRHLRYTEAPLMEQAKTVPNGIKNKNAKPVNHKETTGKTSDPARKNSDRRASPQKRNDCEKMTPRNDKPGKDTETDTEEEEEDGDFFKCKLPACGQSYSDVAGLKAHIRKSHPNMTLFPCPYCSCLWSDYNRLMEHIPAHVGPTPYRCVQCDVCFKKNSSLRKHLKKSHHVNKLFKCTFKGCEFVSNLWTEFKVHNFSYHTAEKVCTCFACNARFTNLNDYFLHIESGMETLICCSQCSMKAKMRHTILRHSNSVHPGFAKDVFVQTTVKCAKTTAVSPKPVVAPPKRRSFVHTKKPILHECSQCDFADENKASFDKHAKSHETLEKLLLAFCCSYCPFSSSDILQYKMHIANHRSKPTHQLRYFKCTHCPFVTNQMTMIERHLQEKHKERPFKFEVQQEVVTAKCHQKRTSSGIQKSGSKATSQISGNIPKSGQSPETASSGSARKKDLAVKHATPVSTMKHGKAKRRRRSKRTYSDEDDEDDDVDISPMDKKSKHNSKPEQMERVTERSSALRRSCRIVTKPLEAKTSGCSTEEAEASCEDDEQPVKPSKPVGDTVERRHTATAVSSVDKALTNAGAIVENTNALVIDRFHCDSCTFSCSDWQVFHDHVKSSHENCTQWSNISMSVTSAASNAVNTPGGPSSTAGERTTTLTDNNTVDAAVISAQDEPRYCCNLCSAICQEWDTFKTHMADAHSFEVIKTENDNQNIMAIPIEKPSTSVNQNVHRGGQFRCQNCTFSTNSKTNMWRHNKGHTLKLKTGFKCMYCSYSSIQKFVITRHVQNYHPDKPSDQTHVVVLQSRKMPTICLRTSESSLTPTQRNVQTSGSYDVANPERKAGYNQSSAILDDIEVGVM